MRLDFTTASPDAVIFQRKAIQPAQAAAAAERGKEAKYGGCLGGVGVEGLALELTGRHGPNLDALLRRCAGYGRAKAAAHGKDAPRLLQQWRSRITLALARFTASAIASACETVAYDGWRP